MNNVFVQNNASGLMKVANVMRSNQRFTYVNELDCSRDERYLAAMWLSVAPEKKYSTKEFNINFKSIAEEENQ